MSSRIPLLFGLFALIVVTGASPVVVDHAGLSDARDRLERFRKSDAGRAFDREDRASERASRRCGKEPLPGCTCVEGDPGLGALRPHRTRCFRAFESEVTPLSPELREAMTGVSWKPGCPVGLDALSYVVVSRWTREGQIASGELVVASRVADDVVAAFERLYEGRFPVDRMELIEAFSGDDDASMAANNTSSFNCRPRLGGSEFSRHSYGEAIDLNPLTNPYVRGKLVAPPAGRSWLDRRRVRPGMIVAGGVAVAAFESIGWKWGGSWKRTKDFQHFSSDGN